MSLTWFQAWSLYLWPKSEAGQLFCTGAVVFRQTHKLYKYVMSRKSSSVCKEWWERWERNEQMMHTHSHTHTHRAVNEKVSHDTLRSPTSSMRCTLAGIPRGFYYCGSSWRGPISWTHDERRSALRCSTDFFFLIFFSFIPATLVSHSSPFTKTCTGTAVMFPQLLYSDRAKNNFIRVWVY